MQIEADAQEIVTPQSGRDFGPGRQQQTERTRCGLAEAPDESPPAVARLGRRDALGEHGVHGDLDRIGTGAQAQAGEAPHQRRHRAVRRRELEGPIVQASQPGGTRQHVGGAGAPGVDGDRGASVHEPARGSAGRRVGGHGNVPRAEDAERRIATRHADEAHGRREVERPFDRQLDPLVHWETSAGDSTVWGMTVRDGDANRAAPLEPEESNAQMSLSPSAQAVLDQLALLPPPPDFATITPGQEVDYIQASRAATAVARDGEAVARVDDVTVASSGQRGRVYVPESAVDGRGLIVHFHGGGWLTGSIEMSDDACRFLANRSGCVVLSAGYRFAPEHPFPAAADDAYAAFAWATQHAADYGADGARIAVIGTSAGANLAAAICLRAADEQSRRPVMQVLVYPPLDATFQSRSYVDNATGYYLTADQMRWFWGKYAGDSPREHPYLSPVYASDLRGQPPALVITAEFDPLRDDGERYAAQLETAGVAVELRRVPGQIHSFMGLLATVPEARECWTLVADRLRSVLG